MSPTRRRLLSAAGLSFSIPVAIAGCLDRPGTDSLELVTPEEAPGDDWTEPDWRPADGTPTEDDVDATTAVADLEVPWDLAFAGDDAFLTERDGGLRRFDAADLATGEELAPEDGDVVLEAGDLPDRAAPGEGGTLGVAVHPDYPDPAVAFVYYTVDDGGIENRVVRCDLEGDDPDPDPDPDPELTPILEGVPGATTHNGGRITFGPDNHLWVTTGDAQEPALAQDPGSLAGSVLRLTPDGDPASGNPDWGADGDDRIYTLGHRNPQGIDFTPEGTPLIAEHGPSARDEVSVLRPGGNYGWPVVRGGPDDSEYGSYDDEDHEAATPPVVNTGPEETWAPSGLAFYADGAVGPWENHVLVCGLASGTLYAVALRPGDANASGDSTGEEGHPADLPWLDDRLEATVTRLFEGTYGRLRHVEPGPDGSLYLLTSNRDGRAGGDFPRSGDDRVVRLEP
ncbi:Glucose/arabinose dehydrogenase, beta-propeller fold [Halobiforma haloterrestris]|uniref:Glucose/arabinose dehydrogenase, beta-propeller fold n=1 Tax=Natronobacterium haloterrestre TaxID=148448 RepID=A0A1I1FBD8_NATHA|nr:PQQ-dependent sugar dehydrogenase [Halobiforma haloterrestris]SFB96717.1 Glucose/arabinose dehydrogenase, beta-propeller fold [Halobiforma haloterrestris]